MCNQEVVIPHARTLHFAFFPLKEGQLGLGPGRAIQPCSMATDKHEMGNGIIMSQVCMAADKHEMGNGIIISQVCMATVKHELGL